MFTDQFDDETLPSALLAAAERWPDRPAYVFDDGRLTFGDVAARAASVTGALQELAVGPGDRVAVLMAGYREWPEVTFGVAASGAVLVPLNTRLAPPEIADLLDRSHARAVIYRADAERGRDLQGRIRAALATMTQPPEHVLVIGAEPGDGERSFTRLTELTPATSGAPAAAVASADTAEIIYTSGSTGRPKGAMLNHRAMLRGAWYLSRLTDAGPEDRIFSPQPFFHAGGAVQIMLFPIVTGMTSVVQAYYDAGESLALMERERCTLALGHQPHWIDYLADPTLDQRELALRSAYIIGDSRLRRAIHDRLGVVTLSPYSMTETHLGGASASLRDGVEACLDTNGTPFPGIELTLRDPATGEPVASGQIGEVCFGGWCPTDGYVDEPELTAAAFDATGAFRTGDLGVVDDRGRLRLAGRIKDMIRVGGENVSAGEVADVLAAHPAVKQAVVVALEDVRLGEVVGAAVECHRGSALDVDQLQTYCSERMARFKVPRRVELVSQWPMTGTGKIDRQAVRQRLTAATSGD